MAFLKGEVVEVDRLTCQGYMLVGARQQQQILDEALHPLLFGQHHLAEFGCGHPVGMGERHLGVLANGRDRRTQFVRRVGYEAALAVSRTLQPLQHPIHGGGEPADLVIAS